MQFSMQCFAVQSENKVNVSNDYLMYTVEQDSNSMEYLCFNLSTKDGSVESKADDNQFLLYKNFFTGYTTVSVDGNIYVYGTGTDTAKPCVTEDNKHISSQNFGDVEVRQELSFVKGFTDVYDDMLKISYTVTNKGESAETGIRIMLDPMLGDDDTCIFNINGTSHRNEIDMESDIPKIWSIKSIRNEGIQAYGKITDDCIPDKMIYADWNKLYDNRWSYYFEPQNTVNDSAVAFLWNEKMIKHGNSITYTIYYGVKNTMKIEESSVPESSETVPTSSTTQSEYQPSETTTIRQEIAEGKDKVQTSSDTQPKEIVFTEQETKPVDTGYVFPCIAVVFIFLSGLVIMFFVRKRGIHHEK